MQCWVNGPATDGIGDKIKMAYILLETNIPTFSPSRRRYEPEATIPLFHFRGEFDSPIIYILSMGYRNYETSKYYSIRTLPAGGQYATYR